MGCCLSATGKKKRRVRPDAIKARPAPSCCLSTVLFCRCDPYQVWVPNESKPGQGYDTIRDFDNIGLTPFTIRKFYGLFRKIDVDDGGTITLDEFYNYFKGVPRSGFADRMFTLLDQDRSGEIDFREFVLATWNLCSLHPSGVGRFAFNMVDTDGSNVLDLDEIKALMQFMMPSVAAGADNSKQVQQVLRAMDTDGDGEVTCEEFLEFSKIHPILLKPGLDMQRSLRRRTFGDFYWSNITKRRWGKAATRDPLAPLIKEVMSMKASDAEEAFRDLLNVMDDPTHRALVTRANLLERWLPDTYGGQLKSKAAVLEMAKEEVQDHAAHVQREINKSRRRGRGGGAGAGAGVGAGVPKAGGLKRSRSGPGQESGSSGNILSPTAVGDDPFLLTDASPSFGARGGADKTVTFRLKDNITHHIPRAGAGAAVASTSRPRKFTPRVPAAAAAQQQQRHR